jgi:Protein of unknown function (DUF732)
MTRRWLVAVTLLAALAGCGDRTQPPSATTASAPVSVTASPSSAPATATPTATRRSPAPVRTTGHTSAGSGDAGLDAFVAVVRSRVPEVAADRRDEEIEAVARQACASLAAGKDADALVAETRALGTLDAEATDQATARELIKLAIDTVCPAQKDRVDEF